MAKIKLEKTKPMQIAYIEHTGSYDSLPFDKDFTRLYGWAKQKKLKPGFRPMGIYMDPPHTPAERRRSEIAIPFRGTAKDDGEIHVRELPAMEVASTKMKGLTSEFEKTYEELRKWTEANGYEWVGAPIETYLKKPKTTERGVEISAKVQVPIRKR